jgi:hypothetical protein
MNQKKFKNILLTVLIGTFIIMIGYFVFVKNPSQVANIPTQTNQTETLEYENAQYGFSFSLPQNWKGYSVMLDKWIGQSLDNQDSQELSAQTEGPEIILRHPLWTSLVPRQDIPIMIFTIAQWDSVQQEKLSLGPAPIPPSELGRNAGYVFALPARYNFAFPVGFEEVEKIIEGKPLRAF